MGRLAVLVGIACLLLGAVLTGWLETRATELPPCGNVQVMGTTQDGRKDFGLAWIGHDLIGGDGNSAWIIANADQCMTPANGLRPCGGITTLGGIVVSPSATIADQVYPSTSGSRVFFANPSAITVLQTRPSFAVTQNFAVGFQFIAGMILDTSDPTNQVLYVGDDPANGLNPNQRRMWSVPLGPAPVLPSAPAAPAVTGGATTAPTVGSTTTGTTTTTTAAPAPSTTTTTSAPAPSTTTTTSGGSDTGGSGRGGGGTSGGSGTSGGPGGGVGGGSGG